MKPFSTVTAALKFFYRRREALVSARGLPLKPREVDQSVRTDGFEARLVECMSVGLHTRGLSRLERLVLDLVYSEHLPLKGDPEVRAKWGVREHVQEAYRKGRISMRRGNGVRNSSRLDNNFLIAVRRDAERKVERSLERVGLLE